MGPRVELVITLLAFASAAVLLLGSRSRDDASDDRPDGDFESPYTGQELADRIQAAIDEQGAYTLEVQQTNFGLPQWGGSEGGTVTVGRPDIKVAVNAELQRTGDGLYSMWLREGRTFFRRSTCPDAARMPGGGGQVLDPFVFLGNDRIRNARNLKAASGRTTLMLTLDGIGEAEISFLPGSFLPNQLSSRTATNNGQPLVWTFRDWGQQPPLAPAGVDFVRATERGPGGNPC